MVNVGLIGCGYWGMNYVRVFSELSDSGQVTVCDTNPKRLREVQQRFPRVQTVADVQQILDNDDIHAVVIATPTCTHYEVTRKCLTHGKHVLVEKPLTLEVAEGEELVDLAETKRRSLMVGHTFLYNPAVKRMKAALGKSEIGEIYYLHATRTHLGLIRSDVNVIWDLAPHDVSIFNYLLESTPLWVSAVGARFLHKDREDAAFITLGYPHGVIGNIRVSWIDSHKVREVNVVGSKKRVVFDDLNNLEKVRIFEKGAAVVGDVDSFGEFQLSLRDGDIISPKVEASEPLKNQCAHFLECIEGNVSPLTDGQSGVDVVRVMQAIDQSLRTNGAPAEVWNESHLRAQLSD